VGFPGSPAGVESGAMADLAVRVPAVSATPATSAREDAAARAQLRAQIATLERQLSDALIACLPYADGSAAAPAPPTARTTSRGPRLLDLGDLERARDELAARLSAARAEQRRRGERAARARARLEAMHLEPGHHRFEQVTRAELGEGRCGVWQVRPRLGLLGMLMGWWEVKLSSGCPLAGRPPPAGGAAP
jgi:hypothetical protein